MTDEDSTRRPPPPPPGGNRPIRLPGNASSRPAPRPLPTGGGAPPPPPRRPHPTAGIPADADNSAAAVNRDAGEQPSARGRTPVMRPSVFDEVQTVKTKVVSKEDRVELTRRRAIFGGVAAVAAAGLAGVALWPRQPDKKDEKPVETGPAALPDGAYAPAGWEPSPSWQIDNLRSGTPVAVSNNRDVWAVVDQPSTGEVAVQKVTGGKVGWTWTLPAGQTWREGPVQSRHDGREMVFIRTSDRIVGWDASASKSKPSLDLKTDVQGLFPFEGGLLVHLTGSRVGIVTGGKVKQISVPSKFYATAVLNRGKQVLAQDNAGKVVTIDVAKNKAGEQKKLAGVGGCAAGTWLWSRDGRVYSVWVPKEDTRAAIIRCYDIADEFKPVWTSAKISTPVSPWVCGWAYGQGWAVFEGCWVNMRTGQTRTISSGFAPIATGPGYAWSQAGRATGGNTNYMTLDSSGALIPADTRLAGQVLRPMGEAQGQMLAVSTFSGGAVLYALPRQSSVKARAGAAVRPPA